MDFGVINVELNFINLYGNIIISLNSEVINSLTGNVLSNSVSDESITKVEIDDKLNTLYDNNTRNILASLEKFVTNRVSISDIYSYKFSNCLIEGKDVKVLELVYRFNSSELTVRIYLSNFYNEDNIHLYESVILSTKENVTKCISAMIKRSDELVEERSKILNAKIKRKNRFYYGIFALVIIVIIATLVNGY